MIKLMSEPNTPKQETMYDGKISKAGELVVKFQYMKCIKDNTKWYWEQKPQHTISFFPHAQFNTHDLMPPPPPPNDLKMFSIKIKHERL